MYLAHQVSKAEAHEDSSNASSDEALPGLLWAELDEGGAAHREAKHVRHDVVDDDHHDWHDEPDEALKHVLDDEVALGDNTEQRNMGPGEQRELPQVVLLHKGEDKPDKPEDVQGEGDEPEEDR